MGCWVHSTCALLCTCGGFGRCNGGLYDVAFKCVVARSCCGVGPSLNPDHHAPPPHTHAPPPPPPHHSWSQPRSWLLPPPRPSRYRLPAPHFRDTTVTLSLPPMPPHPLCVGLVAVPPTPGTSLATVGAAVKAATPTLAPRALASLPAPPSPRSQGRTFMGAR